MNKLKLLIALLGLIILPIVANLIFLFIYPFLLLSCLFTDDEDFYEQVRVFKESLAKF